MDIRITKGPDGGDVKAIPSKSLAHRTLIAALLSGIDISEACKGLSDDISATVKCLEALKHSKKGPVQLPCGESGSTLRFLIPLAAVLGVEVDFICEGRLAYRPMEAYLKELDRHGARVTGINPKHLTGRLTGGSYHLPGDISSQYFTALLMALPLADRDSEIIADGILESRPYIDITLNTLKNSGIEIIETEKGFFVPGNQTYDMPEKELYNIEGDWSNAAFWLVASLFTKGAISCTGLNDESLQGDRKIKNIIRQIIEAEAENISIDVSDTPDLVPAIALLACGRPAGSLTEISNAARLRMKESDRLMTVTDTLNSLGADLKEFEDHLIIKSRNGLSGGKAESYNDHRIAMMAAIASCISEGTVTICGAEAVNKSYPGFYRDFESVGGKIEWL